MKLIRLNVPDVPYVPDVVRFRVFQENEKGPMLSTSQNVLNVANVLMFVNLMP